jgi:hypothetical protein
MRVTLYRRMDSSASEEVLQWNGIPTGIKYQCVEFARRYYLIKYNHLFDAVSDAQGIATLSTLLDRTAHRRVPWPTLPNSSASPLPVQGSLLLWAPEGRYAPTGHVAVATYVGRDFVDVAEQNYGQGHRRLSLRNGVIQSKGLIGWKQPPKNDAV